MTYGKIDFVDLLMYPLFLLGSLASSGWLPPIGPVDLQATLVTLPGPTPLPIGSLLAIIAIIAVIAINRPRLTGQGAVQLWIVIATFGLILGPPFMPIMDALLSNPLAVVISFFVQTAGYMSASWVS